MHTNKINGKKYIGITSQKPSRRWRNGNGYANNEHFYRSIQKYGWHNFAHEILYEGLTKEVAEALEMEIIGEYDATDPAYGYNIESGGNSTEKFTDGIRKKISASLMGHECSEEIRKKISESLKGKPSSKKGVKMTDEQVEKNRQAHKGQVPWNKGRPWKDDEKARCGGKAIVCVELNKVYRSAHEASKDLGVDFSSICKCAKGKVKSAGGYHWVYAEVTNG